MSVLLYMNMPGKKIIIFLLLKINKKYLIKALNNLLIF